jgi:hypothetical protein
VTTWSEHRQRPAAGPRAHRFARHAGRPRGRPGALRTRARPGPVLTALLCGPTALGPRIGGRLGTRWQAAGRRLGPVADPYPNGIPAGLIDHVDRLEITPLTPREHLDSYRFRCWAADKVINKIPGSGT